MPKYLIISLFFISVGCNAQKQDKHTIKNHISDKFQLHYTNTVSKGGYIADITIEDTKVKFFRDYPQYAKLDTTFILSEEAIAGLVETIRQSDFFSLSENIHLDPYVSDYNTYIITTSLNDKKKKVVVSGYTGENYKNPLSVIIEKMEQLMPIMKIRY